MQLVSHGQFQDVAVGADVVERKPFEIFRFDLRNILAVLFREDDFADSSPFGIEDLLLDAAYRKNTAAQGSFTGHGDVVLHFASRKR